MLAQCYTRSALFPKSPKSALKLKPRLAAVLAEVASSDADIALLQEVEKDWFESTLAPALAEKGYGCLYKQRTAARKAKLDGSAILWRRTRFTLAADVLEIEFNDLAPGAGGTGGTDSAPVGDGEEHHTLVRDNIGLVAAFTSTAGPSADVVVATAHLYWDPRADDVKVAQTRHLIEAATCYAQTHAGDAKRVVIGGDLNSLPGSEAVRAFEAAGLASAYGTDTPEFTTLTPGFTGCIDWIFHGSAFAPTARRQVPPADREALGEALPSHTQPSDHLMLVCDLAPAGNSPGDGLEVAEIPYKMARAAQ